MVKATPEEIIKSYTLAELYKLIEVGFKLMKIDPAIKERLKGYRQTNRKALEQKLLVDFDKGPLQRVQKRGKDFDIKAFAAKADAILEKRRAKNLAKREAQAKRSAPAPAPAPAKAPSGPSDAALLAFANKLDPDMARLERSLEKVRKDVTTAQKSDTMGLKQSFFPQKRGQNII
jgi:hypothetical protein